MNLSNKLTVFRIILIPIIVLVELFPYAYFNISIPYISIDFVTLSYKNIAVLVLFTVASFTDFLDGYIARSRNQITVFGKFLDPIADKLLVNTLFIIFAVQGVVPVVAVLIMIWRDTVVDAVRMLLSQKGLVMAAGYLGKVKTAAQMIAIILVLLNNLPFELYNIPVSSIAVWFATLMSLLSGASYVIQSRAYISETI
ncbi:CDP-diacylglycerol--glycerol-3-phosphate 3-phosphatidyltransferase [Erysipelothrix inopinata]|uniref:CDP-diacylglycerol--glycerol-3-phosphate 3-phosphatidyltransferase n=1 Tax=Erysipelothrix inopinata TaxID=225084 RepID=A0A7G9RYN5_9FIRM|nr:CDP-diacylglycerol--glycerol-3-phosphate 3-phosphatidyltransferase [Erysipelothrix inopinata]QNN60710.1 CDP-diacylglycerol--glycerol-3-phosphate 3-phosphatidyltransferase [Erysipelothrix inopinata]